MNQLLSDLRYGVRLLLRAPVTSAPAVLSLALGIGGTTMFLMCVALAASYIPVRRMLTQNPLASLRDA